MTKEIGSESIRIYRQIILIFVLTSVIAAVLAGFFLHSVLSRTTLNNWMRHQEFVSRVISPQCDFQIQDGQRHLEFLARMPAFSKPPKVNEIDPAINGVPENIDAEKRAILREFLKTHEQFSAAFILEPNGDHYLVEPFEKQIKVKRTNFSNRPYFKEVSQTKKPVISDGFYGGPGVMLVVMVVPVTDAAGNVTSYLGGPTYLTDLSRLVAKDRIGNFDSGFIVDKKGNLIAHSNTEELKSQSREGYIRHPLVSKYLRTDSIPENHPAVEEYVNPMNGKVYLASFVKMQSGWVLGLNIEKEAVLSEIRPALWKITMLVSVIVLAVCATGVLFVRRIGRRWEAAEAQIKASLKEKETLLREIHHRVKNNMNVASSLLKLQSSGISDPKVLQVLGDTQNRIKTMALIHDKLYRSENLSHIHFQKYVADLIEMQVRSYGVNGKNVSLKVEIEEISFEIDMATPCALIINELVSNAFRHAFPQDRKGEIAVTLHSINKDEVELIVSDDGVGFPADFDFESSDTFGLYIVNLLVEQLEGAIDLDRDRDGKTSFRIRFRISHPLNHSTI